MPTTKPSAANVFDGEKESARGLGGPDLVPVYAYRPDGVKYQIQMSPKDAARDGFELVNPPPEPEPKARKPKDKSRTKATAKDKSTKPKSTKSPSSSSK